MRIYKQTNSNPGFTLIEIMIVVSIIGMLATIAVCNFMVARDSSRLQTIRHNLGKVEAAKESWAMDNRKNTGAPVADITVLSDYFHGGAVHQVVQETYVPNPIGMIAEATLPPGVKLGPYGAGASIPAP
jgi:prepilin-type N-terminal cleavage/methylation domain-containing protein